ncbi:hypothetical protein LTS18_010297 [Coniosporium uncinatum]|uniref:Uncharacterized protein n=1 Tax=Coniosporium uncinatum TaxID=93489 RepID=A0ACC3D9P2_9PEZI|nr:hypothetical protein LTS18_010297 [Coniosporium uncinatum]
MRTASIRSHDAESLDFIPDETPRASVDGPIDMPAHMEVKVEPTIVEEEPLQPAPLAIKRRPVPAPAQRPQSLVAPPSSSPNSTARLSAPPTLASQYSTAHLDATPRSVKEFAVRFSLPEDGEQVQPAKEDTSEVGSPTASNVETPVAVLVTDATTTVEIPDAPVTESPVDSGDTHSIPTQTDTPASRNSHSTTARLIWASQQPFNDASSGISFSSQVTTLKDSPPQDNTTTDLRFSTLRPGNNQLPDVKEEPSEEKDSVTDTRANTFKFPLPGGAAGKREPLDTIRLSRELRNGVASRPSTLADMRAIPSLNFSHMNLFSKLNEAFASRSSRSLELPTDFRDTDIVAPMPSRPASSVAMRDKYKSFFASLEEMERSADPKLRDETVEVDVHPSARPMTPEDIINEVNRLSVPSVQGLTQRLSELLPSFKRFYDDENIMEDQTVESTIHDIRELGRRVVVPRVEELPDSLTNDDGGSSNGPEKDGKTAKRDRTPVAELEAPCPAHIRVMGPDSEDIEIEKEVPNFSRPQPKSRLSGASSPSSRPWNVDGNYSWNESMPSIDIRLPPPSARREAERKPSRLRLRTSDASSTAEEGGGPAKDSSPDTDEDHTGTTNDTFNNRRRSVLGSISRKIGLHGSSHIDSSGFPTGPRILVDGGDDRAVDPGDRYPTTGLSPPSAFNLEEVRSFFSDDSSQHGGDGRGGSFRKRLTHLRSRVQPLRAYSAMDRRSIDNGGSGELHDVLSPSGGSLQGFEGNAGMPMMEFRVRKLMDRVKVLWFKSGELIRSMSGRRPPQRGQDNGSEWVEESTMYSGT